MSHSPGKAGFVLRTQSAADSVGWYYGGESGDQFREQEDRGNTEAGGYNT